MRTKVITTKITKSVSPKPSTPARPVAKTMNAAATAEIKKVTTVPNCSPRVRFHGVVGSGIAVVVCRSVTVELIFEPSTFERSLPPAYSLREST